MYYQNLWGISASVIDYFLLFTTHSYPFPCPLKAYWYHDHLFALATHWILGFQDLLGDLDPLQAQLRQDVPVYHHILVALVHPVDLLDQRDHQNLALPGKVRIVNPIYQLSTQRVSKKKVHKRFKVWKQYLRPESFKALK